MWKGNEVFGEDNCTRIGVVRILEPSRFGNVWYWWFHLVGSICRFVVVLVFAPGEHTKPWDKVYMRFNRSCFGWDCKANIFHSHVYPGTSSYESILTLSFWFLLAYLGLARLGMT